ncbi:MAG: [FeFe] hydrogenase H-cluster radical SAM maturase HydE [Candidatus Kapabacteria bacterium]|nr:[FeFe] hydrogenase H-cluster radical SAM maturase HydE [Candidatus Kapabacteria bacterium]
MNPIEIKKYLLSNAEEQQELFALSNNIREKHIGRNVYFRGIIEFSNICEKNCFYCGIRHDNENVERFRMDYDEIKECLRFIKQANFGSVVLQSGEMTSNGAKDYLLQLVDYIHLTYPEYGITISCGELDYDYLKSLKEAGATRYLLRIETSVRSLYSKLHPSDHSFENRMECLRNMKRLDYQVGTGNMIGIPGQTTDDLLADLRFFQEIDADMFGLGPYVIHEDTPLVNREIKRWWEENRQIIYNKTLNFIAVLRILMPTCNIAAATALDVFNPKGRTEALRVGANIIMPVVTPSMYRKKYLLYQDKPCIDENAEMCAMCTINKVKLAGLNTVLGVRGDSEHFKLSSIGRL